MKELVINTGFAWCFISHSIYICDWTRRVRPLKTFENIHSKKQGFARHCCFKAQNKDEQMGYMSWTACYTAIDFRARLRFPRAVSLLVACTSAGSHLFRFSRRSLRLALQSPARSNYIHETYFYYRHKKSERIGFIVRISL